MILQALSTVIIGTLTAFITVLDSALGVIISQSNTHPSKKVS